MLDLAVAYSAETLERMRGPLADRGIRCRHVEVDERIVDLTAPGDEFEGFDAGFVYPSRLMEGAVIDTLLSVPWVNGRDAVLTSRNKAGVIARLDRAGVPVPDTVMVSNPADEGDVREAFERIGPPVVVKPNSTTRGVGVARIDDLDSFLGVVDYVTLAHDFRATGDRSFLVQEYFPDARDYRVMVLDGEYAGAVERRLPPAALEAGRWKHNVHLAAEATGVDLDPKLRELAERVADELDIAYLGVDLLVTDDRAVVGETNARPTIDEETKYEPGFYDRLASVIGDAANRGDPDSMTR